MTGCFGEVEVGYGAQDAWLESLRCLRCFDNVMLDPDLCILCGLYVDVCPPDCITIIRADQAGLGADLIIPGHGRVAGPEVLDDQIA